MADYLIGAVALALYCGVLLWAAVSDARSYIIPNRLVLILIAAFVLAAPLLLPLPAIMRHVLAGIGVLAVGLALFHFRLLGGGDVKLFAAASLWVGLDLLVPQLLLVFLAGGVLSVVLLLLRTTWGHGLFLSLFGRWMALPRLLGKGEPVPYGIAICLGSLALAPAMTMFAGVI
ncbi:MAG TPA: prepilin peptidase [Alphaproteobacteria bacterium]|nr:prepilin peptidase [Alphaproteobacteria bacterium]